MKETIESGTPTPNFVESPTARLEEERERIRLAYRRRTQRVSRTPEYFELENPAHLLRLQQRFRVSRSLLHHHGFPDLEGCSILDVGCGDGSMLLEFTQWGAEPRNIAGIDLRDQPLRRASLCLPHADLRHGCATALPWPDNHFDIACLHTVLSSILDPDMRTRVAAETARVVKPAGAVLFYDTFRPNPSNPDVREITVRELRDLFPGFRKTVKKISFLPHIARKLPAPFLEFIYPLLAAIPPLCSHHLAIFTKGDPT